ncbi:uncharacterized protein FA14DRAFT_61962 [Meira miltonrushii]|uniref:Uncharacterized protein n=1 Tax=Meira miltonrushii TaxID=1280837 RepID=A0A316V7B8_9BASI|nr:uncharacterized protein FA14DRAFT_61962 [Meira miltonrushii]PWN33416.1 hypothetical protein FA14DRAFT_61962 [Meira miltonrushii]
MAYMPSPSAPPPHYAAATSSSGSASIEADLNTFFDIVPQADQTSFQVGYLGLNGFRAWIKGDVLIKLDNQSRSHDQAYKECTISLHAIESDRDQSITIFSETLTLWQANGKGNAASSSSSGADNTIPSTLPFVFSLTGDLPHCIHLSSSSLEYRLEATLRSSDTSNHPDAFRSTQVHLTRYTRPGPLRDIPEHKDGLSPYTWNVDSPTKMMIQLQKTLLRRADPITVFVRIPPPERKIESLSLRSAEANLVRIITAKGTDTKHELLLAHSGKLCRFNSTRAIILRLQLHPPFDVSNMPYPHPDHDAAQGGPILGRGGGGGCESVTQDTLLHDVHFFVRVLIALRSDEGDRQDVTLEREIVILPGAAGNEETDSDDVGKVTSKEEAESKGHGKAGEWVAQPLPQDGPSTSTSAAPFVVHEYEEEYDGYEDVGRSLTDDEDDNQARRIIDEDGPPPTLLESQNDLQVEVEVEGVGAGVLRDAHSERADLPPSIPGDYVWRSEEVEGAPPEHEDLPPPPPTPPPDMDEVETSGELHGQHDQSAGTSGIPSSFNPPPYMPSTSSSRSALSSSTIRNSASSEHVLVAAPSPPQSRPSASSRQSAEENFPPAYTHPPPSPFPSHQHPPSYEA